MMQPTTLAVTSQLLLTVFAVETDIALINLTPYTWQQSKAPHAYQVSDWKGSFDTSIGSYSVSKAKATIDAGLNPADSAAEVSYQVTDDSDSTIEIRLRIDDFIQGATLPSDEHIEVGLEGVSTLGNSQGSNVNARFNDGGWTPVILGGTKDSLVGNNPPLNWMSSSLDHIGCLTLESLMIPGSHDAGMSKLQEDTSGSTPANTITQTHDIYDQLNFGVRYFDIRPAKINDVYYTGHWDHDALGWQGGMGQTIDEVISDVNKFTGTENNNELIILYLSHTVDADNDHQPFGDDEWNQVMYQMWTGLNHLYEDSSGNNLTEIHIDTFISNGPAVVIVSDERSAAFLQQQNFWGRGFFTKSQFPKYESYAATGDVSTMRNDQYQKMQDWAEDRQSQIFVLSWTMTMNDVTSVPLGWVGFDHLVTRATYANSRIFEVNDAPPTAGLVQWVDFDKSIFPNIVLVDNTKDPNLAALLLAMNRWYYDCNGAT